MSGPDFLDTNILVNAYDSAEPHKSAVAQQLVFKALSGEMVVSTQVLAELAAALLHKILPRSAPETVNAILDVLAPIKTIKSDAELIRRAVDAHKEYGLHFYDGMIVAAAERASCSRIWSEDLNPGQPYFGVRVENPFS